MLAEYGLFYLKNFNNMATRKRLPLDMYDDIPTEMRNMFYNITRKMLC